MIFNRLFFLRCLKQEEAYRQTFVYLMHFCIKVFAQLGARCVEFLRKLLDKRQKAEYVAVGRQTVLIHFGSFRGVNIGPIHVLLWETADVCLDMYVFACTMGSNS